MPGRWGGALITLGLLAFAPSVFAQDSSPAEQESKANYAFASQLGAGIYAFSEGTVQVYRVGGGIGLRSAEDDGWGMKVQIPVTVGFYGFELTEVLESGLPDRIGTLALVPELRFEFPVTDRWRVMPFAAAGVGRDFSADRFNYIFAGGTRSLATFELGSVDLHLGNRLFYSEYTSSGVEFGDDFGGLDSGLDARHSLGFSVKGHRVDGGLFVMNYLYLVSPELVRFNESLQADVQWEFGVTLGTTTPWKILGLTMPRLGVSRRIGSGASTFRFVMGGPFT